MVVSDISIIVSTYQRPKNLRLCLESIKYQETSNYNFEVIVSDDGSKDNTHEIVEKFGKDAPFRVAFTTHEHVGFQLSKVRNNGVKISKAPYLLFVDGDCILPRNHIEVHLNLRKNDVALAGMVAKLDKETTQSIGLSEIKSGEYLKWIPKREIQKLWKFSIKSRFYNLIKHPSKPELFGGDASLWRHNFEIINGFDENFVGWGAEDDDFRLRLRRAGCNIKSTFPKTWTVHLWHDPAPSRPEQIKDGLNWAYLRQTDRPFRCFNGLKKDHSAI